MKCRRWGHDEEIDGGMTAPPVSVIIPAFNAARWISQTLESVAAQTFEDLECVVVDDGSTDETADIVSRFGSPVRLIRQPNGGVARARNVGISNARGRYLAFLDADDAWLPSKLEQQIEIFRHNPRLGLVYTSLKVVDAEGALLRILTCADPADALRSRLLLAPAPPVPLAQSGVVPAEVLEQVGGFDERFSTAQDTDMVCRLAREYPLARLVDPLTIYRDHAGGIHRNMCAFEQNMLLLLHKYLSGPNAVREPGLTRPRAMANLYSYLALWQAGERAWGRAAGNAAAAFAASPRWAAAAFWRDGKDWASRRAADFLGVGGGARLGSSGGAAGVSDVSPRGR
jgi:glycosyltransferase involved in cell wall biosynthesis